MPLLTALQSVPLLTIEVKQKKIKQSFFKQAYWMSGGTACTFLALALDGGERSTSCLCCFIPGKKVWYPLKRRLGRPQSSS
jgi:hypothetical protein